MHARTDNWQAATPRWLTAQAYEQGYWQRLGDGIEAGTRDQLGWYQWRAARLTAWLGSRGAERARGRTLEIGSGPIGIINFLDGVDGVAVDPLEHFYRTRSSLVSLRRPGVTYLDGTGERLPFEDASFSLVIIDNVIDHTCAPERVVGEIARVLRPDGTLYLAVNVHTRWGALLHTALAALRIDKGHPYTFTSARLRRFLDTLRFTVIDEEIEDYRQARQEDRRSAHWTDRLKGYSGLSEFPHHVVCCKQPGAGAPR